MVKAYLRYEPAISFGVIASPDGNITYDPSGRHLLAPALEKISVWDLKKGLSTKTFAPSTSRASHELAVTSVASSSSPSTSVTFFYSHFKCFSCQSFLCYPLGMYWAQYDNRWSFLIQYVANWYSIACTSFNLSLCHRHSSTNHLCTTKGCNLARSRVVICQYQSVWNSFKLKWRFKLKTFHFHLCLSVLVPICYLAPCELNDPWHLAVRSDRRTVNTNMWNMAIISCLLVLYRCVGFCWVVIIIFFFFL